MEPIDIDIIEHKINKYLNKLLEIYDINNNLNFDEYEKYKIYLYKFRYYNEIYGGGKTELIEKGNDEYTRLLEKEKKKKDFNQAKFDEKIKAINEERQKSLDRQKLTEDERAKIKREKEERKEKEKADKAEKEVKKEKDKEEKKQQIRKERIEKINNLVISTHAIIDTINIIEGQLGITVPKSPLPKTITVGNVTTATTAAPAAAPAASAATAAAPAATAATAAATAAPAAKAATSGNAPATTAAATAAPAAKAATSGNAPATTAPTTEAKAAAPAPAATAATASTAKAAAKAAAPAATATATASKAATTAAGETKKQAGGTITTTTTTTPTTTANTAPTTTTANAAPVATTANATNAAPSTTTANAANAANTAPAIAETIPENTEAAPAAKYIFLDRKYIQLNNIYIEIIELLKLLIINDDKSEKEDKKEEKVEKEKEQKEDKKEKLKQLKKLKITAKLYIKKIELHINDLDGTIGNRKQIIQNIKEYEETLHNTGNNSYKKSKLFKIAKALKLDIFIKKIIDSFNTPSEFDIFLSSYMKGKIMLRYLSRFSNPLNLFISVGKINKSKTKKYVTNIYKLFQDIFDKNQVLDLDGKEILIEAGDKGDNKVQVIDGILDTLVLSVLYNDKNDKIGDMSDLIQKMEDITQCSLTLNENLNSIKYQLMVDEIQENIVLDDTIGNLQITIDAYHYILETEKNQDSIDYINKKITEQNEKLQKELQKELNSNSNNQSGGYIKYKFNNVELLINIYGGAKETPKKEEHPDDIKKRKADEAAAKVAAAAAARWKKIEQPLIKIKLKERILEIKKEKKRKLDAAMNSILIKNLEPLNCIITKFREIFLDETGNLSDDKIREMFYKILSVYNIEYTEDQKKISIIFLKRILTLLFKEKKRKRKSRNLFGGTKPTGTEGAAQAAPAAGANTPVAAQAAPSAPAAGANTPAAPAPAPAGANTPAAAPAPAGANTPAAAPATGANTPAAAQTTSSTITVSPKYMIEEVLIELIYGGLEYYKKFKRSKGSLIKTYISYGIRYGFFILRILKRYYKSIKESEEKLNILYNENQATKKYEKWTKKPQNQPINTKPIDEVQSEADEQAKKDAEEEQYKIQEFDYNDIREFILTHLDKFMKL